MCARVRTANTGGPVSMSLALAAIDRSVARDALPSGGKGGFDPLQGLFLRIDIKPSCDRLDHQQRPVLVRRDPHPVVHRRMRLRTECADQPQHLAGRVGPMLRLANMPMSDPSNWTSASSAACRRCGCEMRGRNGVTEQITVAPQQVAVTRERRRIAVADHTERRIGAQVVGHGLAQRGQCVGRRTFDCQQDQMRDDPFAELVNQDLLGGPRRARQEGRHVGTERSSHDHRAADQQPHDPERDDDATVRNPAAASPGVGRDCHLRPVAITLHGLDAADDGPVALDADRRHEIAQPIVPGLQQERPVVGGAR